VPRLTLLFFGVTEDVPEAAKMVTAGTAYLLLRTVSNLHATAKRRLAVTPCYDL